MNDDEYDNEKFEDPSHTIIPDETERMWSVDTTPPRTPPLDVDLEEFMRGLPTEHRSEGAGTPPEMRGLDGMSPEKSVVSTKRRKKKKKQHHQNITNVKEEDDDILLSLMEQMQSVQQRLDSINKTSPVLFHTDANEVRKLKDERIQNKVVSINPMLHRLSLTEKAKKLQAEIYERDKLLDRLSKNSLVLAQDCDNLRLEVAKLRKQLKDDREEFKFKLEQISNAKIGNYSNVDSGTSTREQALLEAVEELSLQNEELILRLRASMEREIALRKTMEKGVAWARTPLSPRAPDSKRSGSEQASLSRPRRSKLVDKSANTKSVKDHKNLPRLSI